MTETTKTELQLLKEQADTMGIEYASNVTIKTLKAKITEKLSESTVDEVNETYAELEKDNLKLVNIIVTPMDSSRVNWQGEIFSVGNSVLGTVTKFVPFGKAWLVPAILVKHIKAKQFQQLIPRKGSKGEDWVESRIVNAYGVQELPMPTKEEIEELAKIQSAKDSID